VVRLGCCGSEGEGEVEGEVRDEEEVRFFSASSSLDAVPSSTRESSFFSSRALVGRPFSRGTSIETEEPRGGVEI
jgi:hypothetical protein